MSRTLVVVLTAHSMFTEGIASRLRKHPDQIDVQMVDSREPDCLARALAARPSVILFEADDENVHSHCPLDRLLEVAPEVKVIQLDRDQDQIQVITGELRIVKRPSDLVDMLLPATSSDAAGMESDRGPI